ncbi:GNAT family N-acetyltransferase [Robertmurraya korlensis]|uniref:GNAT family N-acetyltransferase n=1 Tax=Robertmurraya korlensis TaxID=519977 RepID=UPI00203E85F3|nr:GNAT family N-acetyltransferase [Robertmurraya korlensis]MCM3600904.1 GNAT family N-acetyltransferase [Robertmurraya korlensis]
MFSKRITHQEDLQKAFSIREKVFVEEQGVPLEEEFDQFDTLDADCEHILVYYQDEAVGTGRVRYVDHFGKLERICILKDYRKYGLGKLIISALEEIALEKGMTHAKLHGQTQAEGFYQKLGYYTASDVFMDADIPHVLMIKIFMK